MTKKTALIATAFITAHLLIIAPFVPISALPATGLGMVSMSSMAFALILAARWRGVDRLLGGPDKSYVLHRWLGFFAVTGALGHWAVASSAGASLVPFLADSAEEVGTLAALGLLSMTAAAMVRAIPYHVWKASHMLMGPVFLLSLFHTFFVASPIAAGSFPWFVLAALSAAGLLAWGQTLKRKADLTRLVTVSQVVPFEGGVEVTVLSDKALPAFLPGQFATLAHNHARSEAHPFTIAGGDAHARRFVIRAAGNWTHDFVSSVQPGDMFRLGRGVGRFLPKVASNRTAQLWVAGGVGITPFLAALEQMQPDDGPRVTLMYCIRSRASAGGIAEVERHARRLPQVELIVLSDEAQNGLTEARFIEIAETLPSKTEVYLCGPEGLKDIVTGVWHDFCKTGRIHSERFDFRGAIALTDLIYIGKSVYDKARSTGHLYAPSRP